MGAVDPSYVVPPASAIADFVAEAYDRDERGSVEPPADTYPLRYRIEATRGVRWLRLYSPNARLARQLELLAALHRRGAPTAHPIAGRDERFVQDLQVSAELRHAALVSHADGRPVDRSRVDDVAAVGSAVARLHECGSGDAGVGLVAIAFDSLVDAPLGRLGPPVPVVDLRNLAERLRVHVAPDLPHGICHGDIHAGNACIDGSGAARLFDFDELSPGPFAYDLACYWRKCVLDPSGTDEWPGFLAGYESVRRITPAERIAIPALATWRAVWTMALPAVYDGIWGRGWLRDASYVAAHVEMIRQLVGRR